MPNNDDKDDQMDMSRHHLLDNLAQERDGHVYGSATCSTAIAYPDFTMPDPKDPEITHYLRWIGDRMIRVVAKRGEEGRLEIITTYDDQDETRRFKRDHPEVIAERPGPDLAGRGRHRSR
jgi:hypothetical protein